MTPTEMRDRLLRDEEFMTGLRQALREYLAGGQRSTPWSQVKRELGIQ